MTSAVPRITDPQAIPVAGVDDHLPPVPTERMQPQALRQHWRYGHSLPGLQVDLALFDGQHERGGRRAAGKAQI